MAERKSEGSQSKSQPQPQPQTNKQSQSENQTTRKAWKPKSPIEVVLEQIGRQQEKVEELREKLKQEESILARLEQARKVLQAS
jgi:hypothetical protein